MFGIKTDVIYNKIQRLARLVVQDFTQQYGETYALVVRHTTLRILLSFAGPEMMKISQFDLKTAFFNKDLQETICITLPLGLQTGGKFCITQDAFA